MEFEVFGFVLALDSSFLLYDIFEYDTIFVVYLEVSGDDKK